MLYSRFNSKHYSIQKKNSRKEKLWCSPWWSSWWTLLFRATARPALLGDDPLALISMAWAVIEKFLIINGLISISNSFRRNLPEWQIPSLCLDKKSHLIYHPNIGLVGYLIFFWINVCFCREEIPRTLGLSLLPSYHFNKHLGRC